MPDNRAEADITGTVGNGAGQVAVGKDITQTGDITYGPSHKTVFHGLTPEQATTLIRQVVTELMPVITEMLRADTPTHVHEILTRDGEGYIVVGRGEAVVRVSPLQAEALVQALHRLSPDAPAETRRELAAVAQSLSGDLVPPADFARRAREYAARQRRDRRSPTVRAEAEEPLYIPLALRFRRAILAPGDVLFRREERTYGDIRAAVEAPDPASPQGEPFPALVLLGEPGAGKSTSLRHLGLALLRATARSDRLWPERASLRHLGLALLRAVLDDPSAPLPLFVSLGDHAAGAPMDFLTDQYHRWYGDEQFSPILAAGRLWLLADGLNEMPAAAERDYEARVKAWRLFFQEEFPPGNRALVACRIADYGTGLALPRLEVEPMDEGRIRDFVARRFQDAPEQGENLWQALLNDREARGPERGLYGLARNPFWLVILVDVYRDLDRLLENRAALVQHFVDRWLAYEADRPGRVLTGKKRAALQLALDRLAFAMLWEGQNAPQPRSWALSRLPERVDVGGDRVDTEPRRTLALAESACLLECRGQPEAPAVRFYHQLLLEHFAGRELLRRFRLPSPRGRGAGGEGLDEPPLWRIPWEEKWQFVESGWDPLPPPPTTGWEEATVLAAARAALPPSVPPIGGDAPPSVPPTGGDERGGDWPRLARAVLPHNPPLAGRCLLETGLRPEERARAEVTDRLLSIMRDPAATGGLNPRQRLSLRISCGLALGALGDPRILRGERVAIHPDGRSVRFVEPAWSQVVPAGPFQMGSSRDDPDAYDNEYSEKTDYRPHTVVIPHDYVVGLYPVTNVEYGCFVADGGYEDERWWDTGEARSWLRGELDLSEPWLRRWQQLAQWVREGEIDPDQLLAQRRINPDYAKTLKWAAAAGDEELAQWVRETAGATSEQRRQPRLWEDRRYNNPSQPVVGVCWYEARAYCAWLTHQLRNMQHATRFTFHVSRLHVRLPTEAEWEKAARWDGSTRLATGGKHARRYPWGDEWDETKANTLEGRVLTTTPVGVYPEGAAPCGALDLAGNVWEWTASRWGPEVERPSFGYPYDPEDGREEPTGTDLQIVRSGSWYGEARGARCACRSWSNPDLRYNYLGFRALLQLS